MKGFRMNFSMNWIIFLGCSSCRAASGAWYSKNNRNGNYKDDDYDDGKFDY